MGITSKIYEINAHDIIYDKDTNPLIAPLPVDYNDDFTTLPDNISIHKLIIEIGVIFYKWLHDIGYFHSRTNRLTNVPIDDSYLDADDVSDKNYGLYADDHVKGDRSPYYIPGEAMMDPYTDVIHIRNIEDGNTQPVEIPKYYPVSSDNMILSLIGGSETTTGDSPHVKIPMFISARVKRREPASMGGNTKGHNNKFFSGLGKEYSYRNMGHFADPSNPDRLYEKQIRRWESLVEFTIVGRSEIEKLWLTDLFERFLEDCEGVFLKLGLDKTLPAGVLPEKNTDDTPLSKSGMHYERYYQWFRTQTTRVKGPVRPINDIEIDVIP